MAMEKARIAPCPGPPRLDVTIEIPRGSFLKRGSTDHLDFVSPFPCPFNYGSVAHLLGLEGDLLDAVVLGPRLPRGHRGTYFVYGAVGLTDRGLYDDKLVCARQAPSIRQLQSVVRFFFFYAWCKGWLNLARGQPGPNACEGWCDAHAAIGRARPLNPAIREIPRIRF